MKKKFSAMVISAVLIALVGPSLAKRGFVNVAYVTMVKILINEDDHSYVTGQYRQKLAVLPRLAGFILGGRPSYGDAAALTVHCPLAPSVAFAEYHLRQADLESACLWFDHIASVPPDGQIPHLFPRWVSLTPQGGAVIGWSPRYWVPRDDTNVMDFDFYKQDDIATISYSNVFNRRDFLVFKWSGVNPPPIPVRCWNTLYIRARIDEESFLTLATRIDGELERQLNYHKGTGQWEEFNIPISGNNLTMVYVSLSEHSENLTEASEYKIELAPLMLLYE